MFNLSDSDFGGDATKSTTRTAITGVAIGVAMLTSLVLAAGYFVSIPASVGLLAGALWVASLITAVVLAAAQPGGFWASLKRAGKMLLSWIVNFG